MGGPRLVNCEKTAPCLVYERGTMAEAARRVRGCRSNKLPKVSRRTSLVSLRTARASRPSRRRCCTQSRRLGLTVDVGCDGSVRMRHVSVGPGAPCVLKRRSASLRRRRGSRRLRDGWARYSSRTGAWLAGSDSTVDDLSGLSGKRLRQGHHGARVWLNSATSLTIFEDGVCSPSTRTGR